MNDYEKRAVTEEVFITLCKTWAEEPEEVTRIEIRATGRPVFVRKVKDVLSWREQGEIIWKVKEVKNSE